jgi:predicted amidohydrolase
VIAGYPEKVVSNNPTGPEFYNTALFVGDDGSIIGNHRKNHLSSAEEKWATAGQGFYTQELSGIGVVVIGIGNDLKYEPLILPRGNH